MISKAKVKSIDFTDPPFRRLSNLKINFSDRITLIAGHNGIGKTSILGFVSNTFGFSSPELSKYKSYFGDSFSTNIEQILYISLDEIPKISQKLQQVPYVTGIVGNDAIIKRCRLTKREKYKRARVVPSTFHSEFNVSDDYEFNFKALLEKPAETAGSSLNLFSDGSVIKDDDHEESTDAEDNHEIMANGHPGVDAKIALPTIFLGLKRISSIGEAGDNEIVSRSQTMAPEDLIYYNSFIKINNYQSKDEREHHTTWH